MFDDKAQISAKYGAGPIYIYSQEAGFFPLPPQGEAEARIPERIWDPF